MPTDMHLCLLGAQFAAFVGNPGGRSTPAVMAEPPRLHRGAADDSISFCGHLDTAGAQSIAAAIQHNPSLTPSIMVVLHGVRFGTVEAVGLNVAHLIQCLVQYGRRPILNIRFPIPQPPSQSAQPLATDAPSPALLLLDRWALQVSLLIQAFHTGLAELIRTTTDEDLSAPTLRCIFTVWRDTLAAFFASASTDAVTVSAAVTTSEQHGDDVLHWITRPFSHLQQLIDALELATLGYPQPLTALLQSSATLGQALHETALSFAEYAPMRRKRVHGTASEVALRIDDFPTPEMRFRPYGEQTPSAQLAILTRTLDELVIGNAAAFAQSQVRLRVNAAGGNLRLIVENDVPAPLPAILPPLGTFGIGLPGLRRSDSNRTGLAFANQLLASIGIPPITVTTPGPQQIAFGLTIPDSRLAG